MVVKFRPYGSNHAYPRSRMCSVHVSKGICGACVHGCLFSRRICYIVVKAEGGREGGRNGVILRLGKVMGIESATSACFNVWSLMLSD